MSNVECSKCACFDCVDSLTKNLYGKCVLCGVCREGKSREGCNKDKRGEKGVERRITKETAGELIKNAGVIGLEFKTNPHRTIATLQDGGRVVTVYEHSLSAFTTRDNIHVSYFLLSKVEKEVDDLYYQTLNRSMNRQELNRVIIGRTLKCVRAGFGVLELSTDNQNRVIIESDGGLFYTVVDKDGVARPVDFVGTHETGLTVK